MIAYGDDEFFNDEFFNDEFFNDEFFNDEFFNDEFFNDEFFNDEFFNDEVLIVNSSLFISEADNSTFNLQNSKIFLPPPAPTSCRAFRSWRKAKSKCHREA